MKMKVVNRQGFVPPFKQLGELLEGLRRAARIERQADFAELVSARQQTVSRWEAGLSRPREKQLPTIARVLGVQVEELREAAGYSAKAAPVTFDKPLPVDALSPESFEQFCAYLLQRLFPTSNVHRAGGHGHRQDGTDIIVKLSGGKTYSFQCKRNEEFGPQKVHAAVAKHTVKASQKFILLSRVASPQARAALARHKGWDIWDKDDLSRKVRELPKIEQVALVDIFFAGRRFELIGVTEEGVWETFAEFFAPFVNVNGLFNHAWKLVGRETSLAALNGYLNDPAARLVLLIGPGGSGKSHVLKESIEAYERAHAEVTTRFLARTADITKRSLEELGSRPMLLIVDDAHDRTDLSLLLQHAASRENIRLLFSLRPYGLQHIEAQASNFSLAECIQRVRLEELTKEQAQELAEQVLTKEGGPLDAAKDIAALTYDCPLATVVGSQIVARERKHYDLAKNESLFRTTLFGRFEGVIAGEIGKKSDGDAIKRVLRVIALFQPFYIDDRAVLQAIEKLERVKQHDANRLIKLLIDAGVLFKRGGKFRLSPDVLADYIIEAACVGANGKSTGYAEEAFESSDERLIEGLLLNLGKLDWRLSNGDTSNSSLLDDVWAKLQPRSEYNDASIRAVKAVAYYQPLRAIRFGEELIRRGAYLKQLPPIFRYAAYNMQYLPRACAALWQIGREDEREKHSNPDHAIRILTELCEVQPGKPLAFNEAVVDFGLELAADPAAWSFRHTPLDIVKAIFATEGHTTSSRNHTITFKPFTVSPKALRPLRDRAIEYIFDLLSHAEVRIATAAADSVGDALRYPMGQFGSSISNMERDEWTELFCETLRSLEKRVKANKYDPLVLVGLAKAISWHVHYSKSVTSKCAKAVQRALSDSLEYKALAAMVDGYGMDFRRIDPKDHTRRWNEHLASIASEVIAEHGDGEELRAYVAKLLLHIKQARLNRNGSPYALYGVLLRTAPGLALATVTDALHLPTSITAQFASDALLNLLLQDLAKGREMVTAFLHSGDQNLKSYVGRALGAYDFTRLDYGEPEIMALEAVVSSDEENVAWAGIHAIRSVARADGASAMRLVRATNIGVSHRLADELLCVFSFGDELPFANLAEPEMAMLFDKLIPIPELEGHWTETFLSSASESFPAMTLDFFMARVDRALVEDTWKYRPVNHGPYVHVPLKFRDSPSYGEMLAKVARWMRSANYIDDRRILFTYRARELFEAVFGSFDDEVVAFIERWAETADETEFKLIANVFEEAPHSFVFSHSDLVARLLTFAQRIGPKSQTDLATAFFVSATGGLREGVAGQPFPRDIETRASCERVMAGLSRFSPAYTLYEDIKKNAEAQITRSLRDAERYED